jgi:ABC-type nitrate/sulfonate/bicarbonate transport system ATPase subunit
MITKTLKIENLYKSFTVGKNDILPVLENINLEIEQGEFVTVVGKSGCGKSTLLKIIAGLIPYETGSVTYVGKEIIRPGRDRGVVFQEHRLLPWLKIRDNIGFLLFNLPNEERKALIEQYMKKVGIDDFADAYPKQLSGGMAQRAAIARGLAGKPEILLLDEPFGALDAMTRIQMQKETLDIWKSEGATMVLVTHDIEEAIFLGQKVVVISERPGRILDIINVKRLAYKNRADPDFARVKQKLYDYFFEDERFDLEYAI